MIHYAPGAGLAIGAARVDNMYANWRWWQHTRRRFFDPTDALKALGCLHGAANVASLISLEGDLPPESSQHGTLRNYLKT